MKRGVGWGSAFLRLTELGTRGMIWNFCFIAVGELTELLFCCWAASWEANERSFVIGTGLCLFFLCVFSCFNFPKLHNVLDICGPLTSQNARKNKWTNKNFWKPSCVAPKEQIFLRLWIENSWIQSFPSLVRVKMQKASPICFEETGIWSSKPNRSATEIREIFLRAVWESETFILWEIGILREGGIGLRWN